MILKFQLCFQPFNLTYPDWDPDIQTIGVVLKDGKKLDENSDVISKCKYITTPLSRGIKRKRILEQKYMEGTSKITKTVVQTRSEVRPYAMRESGEMRIVPTGGRFVVSPTIDNNHITVNPFVLNMMRLQSLFSSLNQRLSVLQNFSIPPLENLIFPQFNETAQFENNRFGLFINNLNNVLPSSYQVLTYVYRRIQQLNGQFDQLMQCSIMYNYQNNTSSEEITQKVHIILRKVLKKECKISMKSLTQLRIKNEHNLDPISHCSLSTASFEDMTLPIARETETCNVQRPECSSSSAFLPPSIDSNILSNDCKELLGM
ncbi:hypothetical protein TNIN_365481 [Trichonephila inaurata madagascariensis]|uniref:Uncharacterized protein n=1 Tax=Trichonephila inaurata madagascariensis TaxID=2747483 RepID=A0A8X7BSH5_9ARAC|nr:hypothetical protein TNIN_365481 [Trichonephila inaurata madagascariensis]